MIGKARADEQADVEISDEAAERLRERFESGGEWIEEIINDQDSEEFGQKLHTLNTVLERVGVNGRTAKEWLVPCTTFCLSNLIDCSTRHVLGDFG